jgi:hypothetical protein
MATFFHGTSGAVKARIFAEGLAPVDRPLAHEFCWVTPDKSYATFYAQRRVMMDVIFSKSLARVSELEAILYAPSELLLELSLDPSELEQHINVPLEFFSRNGISPDRIVHYWETDARSWLLRHGRESSSLPLARIGER